MATEDPRDRPSTPPPAGETAPPATEPSGSLEIDVEVGEPSAEAAAPGASGSHATTIDLATDAAPADETTVVQPAPPSTASGDLLELDSADVLESRDLAEDEGAEDEEEAGPTLAGAGSFAEAVRDVDAPLVGQAALAERLQQGLEAAFTTGTPFLAALEGPRGSGKTRLLTYAGEIATGLAPEVRVLFATCREGGGEGPYAPWSRLMLERFGVTPSSSPSSVRAKMATEVAEALGASSAVEVVETTHLLGHVSGVPFPDSPILGRLAGRPDELHERALAALRRFLEGEASRRPVLLLLDNFHWAEPEAWDVLHALTEAEGHLAVVVSGEAPLLERLAERSDEGRVAALEVPPLTEEDVATMIRVLVPAVTDVPEELAAAVLHRSGGLPAAVRELVRALQEADLFVEDEQASQVVVDVQRLDQGDLPVSIADAIRARLQRLDDLERSVLTWAAVQGERFWDGAIVAQLRCDREPPGDASDPLSLWPDDLDAEEVLGVLSRLEAKGFVAAIPSTDLPGAREYAFVVARTRELLYDEIPEAQLARQHAAVARWLAFVGELSRASVAARIAPHLERAGQHVRAARAYLEAAIYERAGMRLPTALRYVDKALELLPEEDVARRITALHERGSALHTLGRYDEALEAFCAIVPLAWRAGARSKGAAALNRIARVYRDRGEDELARSCLLRALELFRAADDVRGEAACLTDLAEVHRLQGELEEAAAAAHQALEVRQRHGDQRGAAVALHTLGMVETARGNLDHAEQMLREALRLREATGDVEGALRSHNALGIVAYERGDRLGAVTAWRAALESARYVADRRNECLLLNNIGEALTVLGDHEEAGAALEQALRLTEELGDRRARAEVLRNLAVLAMRRGDEDTEARLEEALQAAEEYGAVEMIARAHWALGQYYARELYDEEGEPQPRAEESFLTAIDLFREAGNEREAARTLLDLGQYLIERGDLEQAQERLREARGILRRMGASADLQRVERTLAELGTR